jgi:hypothetical protein
MTNGYSVEFVSSGFDRAIDFAGDEVSCFLYTGEGFICSADND